MRSWRIRIGFVPPEYGFVRVTAMAPPNTGGPLTTDTTPSPPPHEDNEAEDAWLLFFEAADTRDALVFGPLMVVAGILDEDDEDGPPLPSKLRDTDESRSPGANITGAGVFEVDATRSEAVSSELP